MDKVWAEKGNELVAPTIFLAFDNNDNKYYIISNADPIVYMVLDKSNITYCIPKKYLSVSDGNFYKINNSSKMSPVSCRSLNNKENFVQKHLMK
jgi:hypothetical protein